MPLSDTKRVDSQLRVISSALAAVFFATGVSHVFRFDSQVELFQRLDFATSTLPVVGGFELLFAMMLLVPRTRPWGAVGISGVMLGASLAHIMTGVLLGMLFVHATLVYAAIWVFIKSRPLWLRVVP